MYTGSRSPGRNLISAFSMSQTSVNVQGNNTVDKGLLPLLRYFHSAYVLYASIKCLKEAEINSFSTQRLQPQEFQRFTRQTMEAYRTYAD